MNTASHPRMRNTQTPCFQCGAADIGGSSGCRRGRLCARCGRREIVQPDGGVRIVTGAGVLRLELTREAGRATRIIALRAGTDVPVLIRRLTSGGRVARIVRTVHTGGRWIERLIFDGTPPPPVTPAAARRRSLRRIDAVGGRRRASGAAELACAA